MIKYIQPLNVLYFHSHVMASQNPMQFDSGYHTFSIDRNEFQISESQQLYEAKIHQGGVKEADYAILTQQVAN